MAQKSLVVDPAHLRAQARVQSDVASFVASMGVGPHLQGVGDALANLSSASACHDAAGVVEGITAAVGADLTGHADKLVAAADAYHRADEELARNLKRFVQ